MKRKRFWVVFGSVCLSIVVLCMAFALIFRLKTVDIEFRNRAENTNLTEDTQTRVLQTGEFDIGKNIVFMNFENNIAKIEKSNPFVKVEQVIRHFPNVVRVYISERIPKYRVKDSAKSTSSWYILDDDFKILDKVSESELKTKIISKNSNYFDQTIEISQETLTFTSAIIGEFAEDNIKVYLSQITAGIYGKTKDFTAVRKIDYSKTTDTFSITMRNKGLENEEGCKILITDENDLYEKSLKAATCFINGQIVDDLDKRFENAQNVVITVYKTNDGKYVASAKTI